MSKRARVLGWTLIGLLPVAILLAAEGTVRLLRISPRFERDAALPPWLDRNILVKDAAWMEMLSRAPRELKSYYSTYEWDRYLFYRLRPNLSIPLTDLLAPPGIRERTRWTLRTNSRGFPGRDVPYGPHPGVFRIVCLGDSSTFGWGVESDEAYPARLEAELRSRHPALPIEVVNLGVCGYSSFQGRILLDREALRYEPDAVTLSYGSNDWSPVPEPFDAAYRRNAGWNGAVKAVLNRSRAYQIYAAFLTRALAGREREAIEEIRSGTSGMPLNVGPEESERNLEAMMDRVRAAGADPILVTNCVPGEMADPVRAAARAAGAPLVDTGALLAAAIEDVAAGKVDPSGRARTVSTYREGALREHPDLEVYLADGCHPNPIGHRILARAVADAIESAPGFRRAAGAPLDPVAGEARGPL